MLEVFPLFFFRILFSNLYLLLYLGIAVADNLSREIIETFMFKGFFFFFFPFFLFFSMRYLVIYLFIYLFFAKICCIGWLMGSLSSFSVQGKMEMWLNILSTLLKDTWFVWCCLVFGVV